MEALPKPAPSSADPGDPAVVRRVRALLRHVVPVANGAFVGAGVAATIAGLVDRELPEDYGTARLKLIVTMVMVGAAVQLWRADASRARRTAIAIVLVVTNVALYGATPTFPARLLSWAPTPEEVLRIDGIREGTPRDLWRAGLLAELRRDWAGALAYYERSSVDRDVRPYAAWRTANVLRRCGDHAKALAAYKGAIRLADAIVSKEDSRRIRGRLWNDRGRSLRDLAAVEADPRRRAELNAEAGASFERASEIDPSFPKPWFNRGNVHLSARELTAARSMYHRALFWDPEYSRAAYNLAVVNAMDGRRGEALAWLRAAVDMDASWGQTAMGDTDLCALRGEAEFAAIAASGISKQETHGQPASCP
jgi:hypothetical protein